MLGYSRRLLVDPPSAGDRHSTAADTLLRQFTISVFVRGWIEMTAGPSRRGLRLSWQAAPSTSAPFARASLTRALSIFSLRPMSFKASSTRQRREHRRVCPPRRHELLPHHAPSAASQAGPPSASLRICPERPNVSYKQWLIRGGGTGPVVEPSPARFQWTYETHRSWWMLPRESQGY